jgi:hypothetical protein
MNSLHSRWLVAAAIVGLGLGLGGAVTAAAQSTTDGTQRDVKQQQRIEQGLKSGQLSTAEAARLERGQAQVDRLQAHALRDGSLSAAEQARLTAAQNRQSLAIHAERHDGVGGNPQSRSSRRMQRDVARDVHQQARIEHGVQSGALTAHETARLEARQAHAAQVEQRAASDGHVGPHEQRHIQHVDNRNSRSIYRKKHNARVAG